MPEPAPGQRPRERNREQEEAEEEVRPAPRPRKQEQEDAEEEVREVAPGVLRLQLPIALPGLGHVNTYALEDDRGVALVDPGLPGLRSWSALRARLAAAGLPLQRVHTVVVTHSHPDHYGGVRRVTEASGATVVAHREFDAGRRPPWLQPAPWGGTRPKPPLRRRLALRLLRRGWSPPPPDRRVDDGEPLVLGGRPWRVRHTPGHTVDHVCLHDAEGGVVLSGDHVLPTITPHISGLAGTGDPLAAYLASLEAVAALPGVGRVLPAHGQPFEDLPGRVAAIRSHHDERLEQLRTAAGADGWSSVTELSAAVFSPRSQGPMADSETYAHLEHLRARGEVERRADGDGMVRYRAS